LSNTLFLEGDTFVVDSALLLLNSFLLEVPLFGQPGSVQLD